MPLTDAVDISKKSYPNDHMYHKMSNNNILCSDFVPLVWIDGGGVYILHRQTKQIENNILQMLAKMKILILNNMLHFSGFRKVSSLPLPMSESKIVFSSCSKQ